MILAGFVVEMVDGLRGGASKTVRSQAEPGNERKLMLGAIHAGVQGDFSCDKPFSCRNALELCSTVFSLLAR